jgi:hypothetical protein
MLWLLWFQAAALPAGDALPERASLVVQGDYLLLRHLVAADRIPAGTPGDFRLLRAPGNATRIELTEAEQAELLRRRLPMAGLTPQRRGSLRVEFARSDNAASPRQCLALNQPVSAGDAIDAARVVSAPCEADRPRARLFYDHAVRAPVATTALAAGSYLGPVAVPAALPQPAGGTMTLRTRVGPVTIDRTATLIQPGRTGRRAFVRLSDGEIVAARLADDGGAQ